MAAACERVDSIRVSELMDYSTYEDPGFTGVYFGFGRPLDYEAPLLQPGMIKGGWGGMVLMLADALGVRLGEVVGVARLPRAGHLREHRRAASRRVAGRRTHLAGGDRTSSGPFLGGIG